MKKKASSKKHRVAAFKKHFPLAARVAALEVELKAIKEQLNPTPAPEPIPVDAPPPDAA